MQKRVKPRPCRFTLVELLSAISVGLILIAASGKFFCDGLDACRLASRKADSNDTVMALQREWRAFVHANGIPFMCTDRRVVFSNGKFVEADGNRVQFDWGNGRTKQYLLLPNFSSSVSFDTTAAENLVRLNLTWRQTGSGQEILRNQVRLVACPGKTLKEVPQ